MSKNLPETSIIIRAFNEERWLPEVFSAIHKQRYKDFEIIVVDSGSVDRTREIAAANNARIVRILPEDFTFGHSLNVGIQAASGSFIIILTAHAMPSNEFWLDRLIKPLREYDTAMVYGGQRGHNRFSKFSEKRDFERLFKPQVHLAHEDDPFTHNANSAIKRELWEKHPFNEGLPGLEDIEWSKYWVDKGMRVLYEPTATVTHVHMETWPQLRHRYYREGMAARWVGIRSLRHIPGELWREFRWCLNDLWQAIGQGKLVKVAGEILRFRYEKIVGTISGIIDSRGLESPVRRVTPYAQKDYVSLVIWSPHQVRLEQRSIQEIKPGEVLIRVSHVGICGTDLEIINGSLGYYRTGMAEYPIVPGHEFSGTIAALGPRVTGLNEGDRVVVECIQGCGECLECRCDNAIRCRDRREVGVIGHDGAYAEYLVTRARYVHKVPDTVTQGQAALTEPLAVVIKGLRRLGSQPQGDRPRHCAVIGAGTIGQFAARVLTLRGHKVMVIDRERSRLGLFNDSIATSETLDGFDCFDWLVEASGDQGVLSTLLQRSATGATLLLMGLPYGPTPFSFESVVSFDRAIVGSVGSSGADFEEALRTLPLIDTKPFLQEHLPLHEFEKAWAMARSRSVLKVMLQPDPGAV